MSETTPQGSTNGILQKMLPALVGAIVSGLLVSAAWLVVMGKLESRVAALQSLVAEGVLQEADARITAVEVIAAQNRERVRALDDRIWREHGASQGGLHELQGPDRPVSLPRSFRDTQGDW